MNATASYEQLFFEALRIRLVEEKVIELYPSDRIQSPVHLSIGQEAVAVGLCAALNRTDLLFCSYRAHAFYLAKGGDLRAMFAELFGKATGCGGGKAGSMHLAAPDAGLMGASAVVASTIPHAVGAALAAKRRRTGQMIIVAFGDGATEEGVYHESLNFAALHKVPVVFLCENNGLAVHSKLSARQSYSILDHASVYGIRAEMLKDGHDLLKVRDACAAVVERARATGEPQFLEVHTYRYKEHVGPGDDFDAGYRSGEDLRAWQAHDPLMTDAALIQRFRPQIDLEIAGAVHYADASPWPGVEHLLADVV